MIVSATPTPRQVERIERFGSIILNAPAPAKVFAVSLGTSLLVLGQQAAAFAQTTTPVQIEFDTDVLFAQVNDWITVFLPILGIGIAIAIALALITFVGSKIVNAFKGGF